MGNKIHNSKFKIQKREVIRLKYYLETDTYLKHYTCKASPKTIYTISNIDKNIFNPTSNMIIQAQLRIHKQIYKEGTILSRKFVFCFFITL